MMFSFPMNLERSITINKPIREVFNAVANFATWPKWSPWLCQEPTCRYTATGQPGKVGHSQEWEGDVIGAGHMELKSVVSERELQYELNFLKPWKSKSQTAFYFRDRGGQTEVRWTMQGSIPVFLLFIKKMMTAVVGNDYERGLSMLKEFCETGKVLTRVDFKGVVEREGFFYVGKRTTCPLKELPAAMQRDFSDLNNLIQKGTLPAPAFGFSFYHKYDMVKGECLYTAGFGYMTKPGVDIPSGLESGMVDKHWALKVDHYGPYKHLGNAWMTAMSRQRSMKKTAVKQISSYEIYAKMPGSVPEHEILTEILLPVQN